MHLADLTGQGEGVRVELTAHSFVRNTHLSVLFSVDVSVSACATPARRVTGYSFKYALAQHNMHL